VFGILQLLKSCNIPNNEITEVPRGISKLTNLRVFHIRHNQLSALPVEIAMLKNLENLNVACNNLTTIHIIVVLAKLKELDVSTNKLTMLPVLSKTLKALLLYNNTFSKLLPIGHLQNLKFLGLSKSQQSFVPIAIQLLDCICFIDRTF
jgi:hypothetical protein